MTCSSSLVKTFPVGLFGVLMMIARVRSLNAAASSCSSNVQSGSRSLHEARHGAGDDAVGSVVLVVRLEDHDFVARIEHGEQRREHRLGRAAADGDLARAHVHAVPPREIGGDGLAQVLRAPGDRDTG